MNIEALPEVLNYIGDQFTFSDMSNCFMGGAFNRDNITKVKMLIRVSTSETMALLPIGLKDDLEKFLIKNKAKYKFFDNRKYKEFKFTDEEIKTNLGYLELYDYQIDAVKTCFEKKCGIVKAGTGSGKTEIFLSLCNLMKIPTLILFARIDLAHQTLERIKKAGIDAGIVQGNNIDEDHSVVMATVQSGHKLKNKYEMVVVDECHRAGADKYIDILSGSDFIYRFGFSATPWVKDKYKNAKVKSFLGGEIFDVKTKKLLDEKRIARPKIHIYPVTQPRNLKDYKYMGAEKHGIVNNVYRNKLIAKLCERAQGQILILIKKIDQGKNLEKLIEGSYFLSGESKTKERREITKRFDGGEEFVLIASTIFDEGIDLKNVNHVFIAGGGASFVKALQRIGRGTRITKTKKEVDIYDFWDDTNPTLLRHSRERIKIYKNYGYTDIEIHSDTEVKKILL